MAVDQSPGPELRALLDSAIAAGRPGDRIAAALPPAPRGRRIVVGAGKASADMAAAVAAASTVPPAGAVAVPSGYEVDCGPIACLTAGHPLPDARSIAAAEQMQAWVTDLNADDQIIALISGGASALLCAPIPGLELADKQRITEALLASGAGIREINCVRQALSTIKGGRLAAAAAPAAVHTLLVSDIPGDDPALIGSGPTIASPFAPGDARAVLARYAIPAPAALDRAPAPIPATELTGRCRHTVLCSAMRSLEAAAAVARDQGRQALILSDALEGEASELARFHAAIATSVRDHGQPIAPPAVLLSGGEASVRVTGEAGRGGRNTEFALALARHLDGAARIHALAADTDGVDGYSGHAGALIGPDTLDRATTAGCDPAETLARHDSARLFEALGDTVDTGATGTNVNDFRAVLVDHGR